jgi:hypothetical protein
MSDELTKLSPAFRAMLSHPRYKKFDADEKDRLLKIHDEQGGLTTAQIKQLSHIYAKYQR